MRMTILSVALAVACIGISPQLPASDLKGLGEKLGQATSGDEGGSSALGALAGNLGMPALGGDVAGSAAGVLGYCIKNKYLDGDVANQAKSRLMSGLGLESEEQAAENEDYQAGLGGLLKGSGGGSSLDLNSVSDQIKDKACDYVLENAGSLL